MTKNVIVTDENGTYVGTTYPKRARGLVKNGRAIFVDDCTIRLSGGKIPSEINLNQTEGKQMNYIYFNPRKWSFEQTQTNTQFPFGNGFPQPDCFEQSVGERSFINDFDGSLVECLMFGDWDTPCVRAVSNSLSLMPETEYSFVFWLNGGENDRNSEVCRLEISFAQDPDDCYSYKLNRGFIKPLLHKQGWELYSIPFVTPATGGDTVEANFAFVSGYAPMAVKQAKALSAYEGWEDEPDEFAKQRPQRHNLVFEDGWPSINMYGGDRYSTEVLRKKKSQNMDQYRQMMQDVAENVSHKAMDLAASAKQVAKDIAQGTRQMAETYRENAEQRKAEAQQAAAQAQWEEAQRQWAEAQAQWAEAQKQQAEAQRQQAEAQEQLRNAQTEVHDVAFEEVKEKAFEED